jgi:hypothetical protein
MGILVLDGKLVRGEIIDKCYVFGLALLTALNTLSYFLSNWDEVRAWSGFLTLKALFTRKPF